MPTGSRFGARSTSSNTVIPLDATTHDMIHATWDQAAALLVRATHVGLTMQQQKAPPDEEVKLSHSVDTLCRHVDYVITGRFRRGKDYQPAQPAAAAAVPPPPVGNRVRTVSSDAEHEFQPPPTDLFDHLLAELQIEAAAADRAISPAAS